MSRHTLNKAMGKERSAASSSMGPMGRGPGGGPPGMGMMMPGQKAKDFRQTMRRLGARVRPHWLGLVSVVVFAVVSTGLAVFAPMILGQMTNSVVADLAAGAAVNYVRLRTLATELLAILIASAGFSYAQSWIMTNVTQEVTYRFRQDIAAKIGRLPLAYFDRNTHGEVLSRITNDVDTVSQTLNQALTQILTAVITLLGITAMMLSISWQMTLVTFVTLPLSFGVIGALVKRSQPLFKRQQDTLGHLNGHIEEMYGGHNVMKVFGGERRSLEIFAGHNDDLYDSGWCSQFLSGLMHPALSFAGNLGYVGVTIVGGYLAVSGRVSLGGIQAFIQYVSQFHQPIIQTASLASTMQSSAAAAERVFEFLAEKEEEPDAAAAAALDHVQGAVEFDHVHFGYEAGTEVIRDFTARVLPGQRVAIVGPTGAGKTTMVNLLMRFYDVSGGAIRIDGTDIRTLRRADVRRLFGMVLQDTWLFHGTIRENLAYGKPEATEDEVVEAAVAARVEHFVRSLPHAYEMVIDEEANNISQGEKQLLTIARAMLVKTPMLILDEATSSVDTRTEALIQQAMERLMEGKTSFVIAHRLSTIRNADLILVMNEGSIVEQGRHEELLAKGGFYAALYNSQFNANGEA